jgi:hypothetical protein
LNIDENEIMNKLSTLKNFGLAGNITCNKLKEIAKKLNINIIVTTHVNKQLRHKSFGNKNNIKIKLALFKNHYFINDNDQYKKVHNLNKQFAFKYKECIASDY